MDDPRKAKVANSFSQAAATYDSSARIQAETAKLLAARVLGEDIKAHPSVLEIGCGTGFLTQQLRPALGGEWLLTDIAPSMLERARTRFGDDGINYRVMDGEAPNVGEMRFNLIVSSLAVQWFVKPVESLRRLTTLLAPGGLLACATLGPGSFSEWREAHAEAGVSCGIPPYPEAAAFQGFRSESQGLLDHHVDGRAFLRHLKDIGAQLPAEGHIPLNPAQLRRVLAQFRSNCAVSYDIVFLFFRAGTS